MTTTQISKRKAIYRKIRGLPDSAAARVMEFIDNLVIDDIDEHEPNAETLEAMHEAEHPERLKSYSSIEEMFRDFGVNVNP